MAVLASMVVIVATTPLDPGLSVPWASVTGTNPATMAPVRRVICMH